MRASRLNGSTVFLVLLAIAMMSPLVATFLNSVATEWSSTMTPEGYTTRFYSTVLADARFHAAVARSLAVSGLALAIATLIMVPAIIAAHIYWRSLDVWMARLVVLPYAIPGIILVVGYLRVFAGPPLQLVGHPAILVITYIPICFPLFYICLKNSLRGLDTTDLLDAGRILGVSELMILFKVILPCILPAVTLAVVLNFAGLMGEFVYAKLLVGGSFETLQMYMYAQRSMSGRISSVIVMFYFAIVLVITLIVFKLAGKSGGV